jgi:hypothetical protein
MCKVSSWTLFGGTADVSREVIPGSTATIIVRLLTTPLALMCSQLAARHISLAFGTPAT